MMKKLQKCITIMLMLALPLGLCSCGSTSKTQKTKEINVLMWEGDAAKATFKKYEKETGIHVNITYVEDTNIMLEKIMMGNDEYDVIDLESAYVNSFVKAKLLKALDYKTIRNAKYIDKDFFTKNKGPIGDRNYKYVVPATGPLYTCVVYNKETCPVQIQSFADLANPQLKGQICSVNATISLYAGALQALGYPVNSTSKKQMQKAQDLLTKIKENVKVFVGSSALSQLESGDCSVGYCWEYNVLCNDSKDNWGKFQIVDSSCLGYNQYWAVSAHSKRQTEAMKLINYIEKPSNVATALKEYGGVPVIDKQYIANQLPKDYYESPYIDKYKELWKTHTDLTVSDKQNDLMDGFYNELMAQTTSN